MNKLGRTCSSYHRSFHKHGCCHTFLWLESLWRIQYWEMPPSSFWGRDTKQLLLKNIFYLVNYQIKRSFIHCTVYRYCLYCHIVLSFWITSEHTVAVKKMSEICGGFFCLFVCFTAFIFLFPEPWGFLFWRELCVKTVTDSKKGNGEGKPYCNTQNE